MNFELCCNISHFAVHYNALKNSFVVCDSFTMCSYNFFQRNLAPFTCIQLWNWLVPSSWHCPFHFYFLQLKPTHNLAINTAFWNTSAIYRGRLHSLGSIHLKRFLALLASLKDNLGPELMYQPWTICHLACWFEITKLQHPYMHWVALECWGHKARS